MQNSIDFQLNKLQPTLAMPTNEDHEVISYWNKRSQFSLHQLGQTGLVQTNSKMSSDVHIMLPLAVSL